MKFFAVLITSVVAVVTYLVLTKEPTIREILTSQQLVVTKLIPLKGKLKKTKQGFEAELREVFKVIKYENDSTYVELDWTLCPNGCCPEMGQATEGTPAYRKIDTIMRSIHSKESNQTK